MNVILYNKKERVEHRSNINTLLHGRRLWEIKRDYSTIYNTKLKIMIFAKINIIKDAYK